MPWRRTKNNPAKPAPYRGVSEHACTVCGKGPDALRHVLGVHSYQPPRQKIG
jgi:hypothetical protein